MELLKNIKVWGNFENIMILFDLISRLIKLEVKIKGIKIGNLSKKDGFSSLFATKLSYPGRIYLRFYSDVKNGGSDNGFWCFDW